VRALLLYNPTATTTTSAVTDVITRAFASALDLEAVPTKRRNHAGFLAASAADEGYEVVIVLGGDGTVNEVIQGIAKTGVALAVIPGGSTNVLVRSLGFPNDAIATTGMVLRKLADGQFRHVNLGLANGRYFAFHAGFGWDGEVVRQVEQRSGLKRTVRQAAFVWCSALAYALSSDVRSSRITVKLPGTEAVIDQRWAVCANSRPYTYVGPRPAELCPVAGLERDLAVVTFERLSVGSILRMARTALTSTNIAAHKFVTLLEDLPELSFEADRALPLQLDGDFVGITERVELYSVRDALRVVG
jgi:diacylglycerol kinase family enzyme